MAVKRVLTISQILEIIYAQLWTRKAKPSNTHTEGIIFNQFNTLMNGASEIYYYTHKEVPNDDIFIRWDDVHF